MQVPYPSPTRILHTDENFQTRYSGLAMTRPTFACLLALSVHTQESLCLVASSEDVYSGADEDLIRSVVSTSPRLATNRFPSYEYPP